MNKPVYLSLSVLEIREISKIVMHEFWYDYVKPKYEGKAKLCYMDTVSLIVLKKKLIPKIINKKNHYLKEKSESSWINER